MIVTVMMVSPPITGAGIAARNADNLVKEARRMNQQPAEIKARLLATQ